MRDPTRAAFRVGVKGMRYTEHLPGLSDPEAAYEAGRALRMIGHILDSQGSPVEHGRLFLSQLASAVGSFALRGERQPWGAEDTAFVFRETFKAPPTDAQKAYDAILPTHASGHRSSTRGSTSAPAMPMDHP